MPGLVLLGNSSLAQSIYGSGEFWLSVGLVYAGLDIFFSGYCPSGELLATHPYNVSCPTTMEISCFKKGPLALEISDDQASPYRPLRVTPCTLYLQMSRFIFKLRIYNSEPNTYTQGQVARLEQDKTRWPTWHGYDKRIHRADPHRGLHCRSVISLGSHGRTMCT